MKRFFLLPFFLLLALPVQAETTLALKEKVSVAGENITLNDLLKAPVDQGKVALFAAPQPGESGTIAVARILEAAQAYGIGKIAEPEWTAVQVEREARFIRSEDIQEAIRDRVLKDLHVNADALEVNLNRDIADIAIEKDIDAPLQFSYFRFDTTSGRFEARLFIPGSAVVSETAPLAALGSAHEMAEAVQLKHALTRGEVISKSDIMLVRMKRQQLSNSALRQTSDAVGMLAKRTLNENTMLRGSDVEKPKLIMRNDMVLILYQTPTIMVTARGKAMMDGTLGDTVEIQNMQSKRNLTGTVSGNGQVTVTTLMPRKVAQLSTLQE